MTPYDVQKIDFHLQRLETEALTELRLVIGTDEVAESVVLRLVAKIRAILPPG